MPKAQGSKRASRAGRAKAQRKVDPELVRQLEEAEAGGDEPVEAVFTLSGDDGPVPGPEEVEKVTRQVIDRAQEATGAGVEDVNVFRYLASFVVRAKPGLIRSLLDQPEIGSAVPNRPQASGDQAKSRSADPS
jgi:hypothetical protein